MGFETCIVIYNHYYYRIATKSSCLFPASSLSISYAFSIRAISPLLCLLQGAFILGKEESCFSLLAESHRESLCLAATHISLEHLRSWCLSSCPGRRIRKRALPNVQEEAPFPEMTEQQGTRSGMSSNCLPSPRHLVLWVHVLIILLSCPNTGLVPTLLFKTPCLAHQPPSLPHVCLRLSS